MFQPRRSVLKSNFSIKRKNRHCASHLEITVSSQGIKQITNLFAYSIHVGLNFGFIKFSLNWWFMYQRILRGLGTNSCKWTRLASTFASQVANGIVNFRDCLFSPEYPRWQLIFKL